MPDARRRNPVPRRRRRDDEDGESSAAGDIDEFSMSEGSALSNAEDDGDAEGSDVSAEEDNLSVVAAVPAGQLSNTEQGLRDVPNGTNGLPKAQVFKSTPDTEAMMTGLKAGNQAQQEELHFDAVQEATDNTKAVEEVSTVNADEVHETQTQKIRKVQAEQVKQKNVNPAFVPNRGGFFLHDDRGTGHQAPFGRPHQRGRGRGMTGGYGAGRGYGEPATQPADQQWAHDLHDTVNKTFPTPPIRPTPVSTQIPTAKAAPTAPNRSFSVSTVLGNVSIQISMPGMDSKKIVSIVKKQHTLLPQHRPPLRRDKPVRISIPEEQPRYIFPSMERSFIFIPRALRPNQQAYPRQRGGRTSFQGSRRGSMFGGSAYTPSIGMSRKSSISISQTGNGLQTPTDPIFRGVPFPLNVPRPVVRMPVGGYSMPLNQYQTQWSSMEGTYMPEHGTPGPAILHSPPVAIPMHQPRPQKTVSVAGIESPAFKAPQQQQEQPFHQQVPQGVELVPNQPQIPPQAQTSSAIGTPLSHIPEGAVYAQPFQPYPVYTPSAYYGLPYPGARMFFPSTNDGMGYAMPMGGPVLAPQFVPNPQPSSYGTPPETGESAGQQSMVAHESNGMVFYYDKSQAPTENPAQYPTQTAGGIIPVPTAPYFYPSMQNGIYYPPAGQ